MLGVFKTSYRVRNIKVTAPDGKVLFEGLPKLEPSDADVLLARADELHRKLGELTR